MPRVLVNLLQTTGTKGGIEVYVRELYARLANVSSEFEFVGYASTELMATDHSWFPGTVINSRISGENRLSWAWGELFSVGSAAKKYDADLIHGPAMFGPVRPPCPVVISVHDLLYFSHPELMQSKLLTEPVKWMEKRAAANATRLITISEYSARAINKYLKFPSERVDVIPLAGRLTGTPVSETHSRSPNLFLAMGQRSPYKDFTTIITAWATMDIDSRPNLIVTGSHGDDPLAPLVEKLGLQQSVQLKSWVSKEELDEFLTSATALIDSTLASGFSMPAVEAMSIGLPVLLADTEVFREVGAGAADYFTAGDPTDLARAVQSLMKSPDRQADLSRLGIARAQTYSWERVAEQTLDSFRRALTGNN